MLGIVNLSFAIVLQTHAERKVKLCDVKLCNSTQNTRTANAFVLPTITTPISICFQATIFSNRTSENLTVQGCDKQNDSSVLVTAGSNDSR
jgi:hypothetical protein